MKKLFFIIIVLFCSVLTHARTLEEIKRSGVIYVAFTESGLETVNYKIALEFARFLNVRLEVVLIDWNETFSINGFIPPDYIINPEIKYTPDALKKADFICGTIYVYPWREKFFDFAGIMSVSDLLIVRKTSSEKSFYYRMVIPEKYIRKVEYNVKEYSDLKDLGIAFLQNSSYESNIKLIDEKIGGGIKMVKTNSEDESQLLLNKGTVDGFIAVSYVALEFLNTNNQYRLAFPIAKPQNVGWAVEKDNHELRHEINNFFETIAGGGVLNSLFKNQFGVNYDTYLEIINSYAESLNSSGRDLDEILEKGKLIVALRDREMVYHPSGQKQFNHYLAEEFAKYLGVDLEIQIVPDLSDYFENENGVIVKDSSYVPLAFTNFDVACDLFVPLDWRLNKIDIIDFVPGALVVISNKKTRIKSINDLFNLKGVISKGSVYEEALVKQGVTNFYYREGNEFFDEVLSGKADYTIVSFSIYSLYKYKDLEAKFVLGELNRSGWGIKKNQPKLRQKILEFIEYARYVDILDQYFAIQTGIPFKAAENYLNTLHQTFQEGYFPFVFYGTREGLPQEDVLTIFQDNDNYIWFGTYAGAVKFNGRNMLTYNTTNGLAANTVFDIKQDSAGVLYFATVNGVSVYQRNKFKTIFPNNSVKRIFIDSKNNKWFYGNNGISVLSSDNVQKQLNKDISGLPQNVNSVTQDNKGRYTYIAASEGLFILDSDNNLQKITNKYSKYIFVDEDDNLWLSTLNGIYKGTRNSFLTKFDSLYINDKVNIPENVFINKITQNSDGSIWLLSDFMAYQIFTLKQKAILYDSNIGLQNLRLLSFLEDKEKNYWFGYSGGIQKLTNRSLRNLFPNILNSQINNIIEDANGRLWLAFDNRIMYYYESLVNFSDVLNGEGHSYVITKYSNSEVLIATSSSMYIVDINTLKVVKSNFFPAKLFNLRNIFITPTNEIYLMSGSEGLLYYFSNFMSVPELIQNKASVMNFSMAFYKNELICGGVNGLSVLNKNEVERIIDTDAMVWALCATDSILYVGTDNGFGKFQNNSFDIFDVVLPDKVVTAITPAIDKNYLWLGTNRGFSYYNIIQNKVDFTVNANDGLPGNEIALNGLYINNRNMLWVATFHGVSVFDVKKKLTSKFIPECRIERILLNGVEVTKLKAELNYNQNNFIFELTGLSYKDEASLVYDFYLKGIETDYGASKGKEYRANYQNLPPGDYEFVYRAKGKDDIWSYSQGLQFTILKPFYLEWWFITILAVFLVATVFIIIKIRERALQKQNEHLEKLVRERTFEIKRQKDAIEEKNVELEQQREEILAQRDAIEEKNFELEEQKTEIQKRSDELEIQKNIATNQRDEIAQHQKETMDSIYYAKRIQNALLPTPRSISNVFSNYFILYKPRDIVSGDFYWFRQIDHYAIIVAADCTGHGVPGAFMSMLGYAFLNEVTNKNREMLDAGMLLDSLRFHIVESLHQTGRFDEAKDGMDIALCIVDTNTLSMQYAGAFNPLYLVRNGVLNEFAADKMPIGIHDYLEKEFNTNIIQLEKNDVFYMFSDGFASQFGGKNGKKYMSSRMKKLLEEISSNTMADQKEILDEKIENWMGGLYDQVDDILVMGFKI